MTLTFPVSRDFIRRMSPFTLATLGAFESDERSESAQSAKAVKVRSTTGSEGHVLSKWANQLSKGFEILKQCDFDEGRAILKATLEHRKVTWDTLKENKYIYKVETATSRAALQIRE